MMYKVKAVLGNQIKSVELDRSAQFPEVKAKLESKFGCSLSLSFKRADGTTLQIITPEHFQQAVKEAESTGAKCLLFECGGNTQTTVTKPKTTPTTATQQNKGFILCSKCGTKLPEQSRFCAGCGAPVTH